jgi:diguanylate cyclase (GGDEF)-like protein
MRIMRDDHEVEDISSKGQRTSLPSGVLVFLVVGLTWLFLDMLNVLGPLESSALFVLTAATLGVIVLSVRRYRPSSRWPWYAIVASLAIFFVGGGLATELHTLGNLTIHRSLLPDLITLPGYGVLSAGLFGFSRARSRDHRRNVGVFLDAMMAALALLACAWVFIIDPLLNRHQTPLDVRLVLICYPSASLFLVVVTLQIAFGPGQRRTPTYWLLLSAMAAMFAGDSLYMLAEIHAVHLASPLLELPYGFAYLAGGAMALHPSMRMLTEPAGRTRPSARTGRIVLVVVSLSVPALLTLTSHGGAFSDRVTTFAIILALTGTAVFRVAQSVQAAERSEEEISFQAMHDSLTGLPNRWMMQDHLTEVLARAAADRSDVAVLYVDLDQFKLVNDTLGHSRGDELLCQVARRLCESVRPTDVVTRLGGDEFMVVLDRVASENRALEVAERIRGSLRVPFELGDADLSVTASIGLVFAPAQDPNVLAEDLVRDADLAMYHAKDAGRDQVAIFDQTMGTRLAERVSMENELRHAIERGELHLVYQPVVWLPKGPVRSLEALIRWEHPTLGSVSPVKFIPIAEETGVILEIGSWVLDEALCQLAEWRLCAPGMAELSIGVNVSALQLHDEALLGQVSEALARHGLPASALCLELTESAVMNDPDAAAGTLAALRDLGVCLAIDDFGTEYSSLAHLKRFPFDVLKIDRSFIIGLGEEDNADETLVAAIVAMAKAFGFTTIVEGVETVEQATKVVELGCDSVQGYLYSRPVKAAEVLKVVGSLSGWAELLLSAQL